MWKFLSIVIGSLLISNTFAATTPAVKLVEGTDYTVLATAVPKTQEPKGKINVKEFFSFTCIHCKDVEPILEQSLVNEKNVDLTKIQVVWGEQAQLAGFAKLNATIQAMNLNQLNVPVFTAVFANQDLTDQKTLKSFLGANGLKADDVNKFMSTYNSFTIASKVAEYKSLTTTYGIDGTPTFVVADKYVAKPAQPARLILVVQALVEKARQEANTAKK